MITRIQGRTHEDRHSVTTAISDAVRNAGGCMLDFNQLSNIAICFTIELPPAGFAKLRMSLLDLNVILEAPGKEELALNMKSDQQDIPGSVAITFLAEKTDRHMHIPAVPG